MTGTPGQSAIRPEGRRRPGRPVDPSADAAILTATLDTLAEQGFEQVTLDSVSARARRAKTTLLRRWPTKVDLVVAAVRSAGPPPEVEHPPDTGSLRDDLVAVIDSDWLGGPERRLRLFDGLVTAGRSSAVLADVIRTTVTEPYVLLYEGLLHRAVERGEVHPRVLPRLPVLAQIVPAMTSQRLGTVGQTSRSFCVEVVDAVLLPALGLTD